MIENLSRAGQRMMGFCKSTFFKRIDSSGFSFLLTIYRHILRNCVFIYAIDNKLPLPIGDENALPEDYCEDSDPSAGLFGSEDVDAAVDATLHIPTELDYYMKKAEEYYKIVTGKNNVAWLPSTYFKRTLKQQLNKDCEVLINMITLCGDWQQEADQKLNELQKLLVEDHKNDKVIVFTQYSDTARYIYNQLKKRGVSSIDVATGASESPTACAEKFSPISNDIKDMPLAEQTRILIATDVLSEGQNLQDAHVIVNFDLPWAIIRLIQRAGRVDRIGQTADIIYCYSFFPTDGVEQIINLRGRLNDRINENANIVGSDEIFFEGNEQNLRDMFNERSGVLDDDDESEVDLSSQAYQIWKSATDARPELKQIIPNLQNMIYSTKHTDSKLKEGVITYARTANDFDILTWLDANGEVISQSQKKILQALECDANEPSLPAMEQHHELVSKAVDLIQTQSATVSGGILGNRFSTRYRIVTLLEHYYEQPATIFFNEESKELLKLAIDDIYNYPLLEQTKFMLGRMLRSSNRTSSDDIVEYVLEMRRTGALCRIEEETNEHKENTIICSMGLKFND
jgi:SNF2 family DNA or RNA helicase